MHARLAVILVGISHDKKDEKKLDTVSFLYLILIVLLYKVEKFLRFIGGIILGQTCLMNGQAKPPTMVIIVAAPITSSQRTAVNIWQVHAITVTVRVKMVGTMTSHILNKVLLANCKKHVKRQDVDEETKHDHDRHQMKSNRDLEETPIFELTTSLLMDITNQLCIHCKTLRPYFMYPSLEESSEVVLEQNTANKYVRITSACVKAFEHIMHHYATEDGTVHNQMSKEDAEQFCATCKNDIKLEVFCIPFVEKIMMNELTITDEEKAHLDEISSMEKTV